MSEVSERGRLLPAVGRIKVLEFDPDLGERLDAGAFEEAEDACLARAVPMGQGPLSPGSLGPHEQESSMGFLVLTGAIMERHAIGGRQSVDLLLPGDLARPWPSGGNYADLVVDTNWWVSEPGALAVLDEEFLARAARWPQLTAAIGARWQRRLHSLSLRLAIVQIPKLPLRLHLMLWHLADRVGVVDRDGVVVPLDIKHYALGEMIGAQRASVTRALKELAEQGLVETIKGGGFRLLAAPRFDAEELLEIAR